MTDSTSLSLWGGHECTVSRVGSTFADQTVRSGHHDRLSDLARFAELGITTLRYPVLWERTSPDAPDVRDFSWADERLAEIRRLGMRPIVGLIHHGSGPAYTDLLNPAFATGLAEHARATAERFPWVTDWTPVNEPLTTARFSCLYGLWYPHLQDESAFWTALLNQIDATRFSMRAIRAVVPHARLIQTEDLGFAHSTPQLREQAAFENDRRWMTWDLLEGRVVPGHALWERLARHGLAERLAVIAADPCPPDVIGINTYLCSERWLDHRADRHPDRLGGDGIRCANVEAVRTVDEVLGVEALLMQTWGRYGRTIAVTEAHNASEREEQMRWFGEVWDAANGARGQGARIEAVTAWSLLGAYDWNGLLTRQDGHYECGVYDVRSGTPRPTAMVPLLQSLARGGVGGQPEIMSRRGWWHQHDRFLPGFGGSMAVSKALEGRPILITGRTGTLGQALANACEARGLPYVLTGRDTLALDHPASIGAALDALKPWAVINCAGMVSLDLAEERSQVCELVNAVGPDLLARACAARGLAMVQLSSDQVFDGTLGRSYLEADPTAPLNVYGRSKADAESRVLAAHPGALVVRTSAFFSPRDRYNFAVHVVDSLRGGRRISVASDELISPTYVPDLVSAMLDLLIDRASGIWHLATDGGLSWADFAHRLAATEGLDAGLIDAVPGASLGYPARRPSDVRLATSRGQIMPSLESAIARFADGYAHTADPPAWAIAAE